jgi:murein DD-endopeptidase MepM/ murein hydrolase activator NlpD
MRKILGRGSSGGALTAAMLALLMAACGPRPDGPAPLVSGEPPPPVDPESIKVRPGQTLSGIAHTYRVPMRVLAEANHLAPPYRIEVGRTLIIPQSGQPALPPASALVSGTQPQKSEEIPAAATPIDAPVERTAAPPTISAPTVAAEPLRPDVKPAVTSPASTAAAEPAAVTQTPQAPASDGGTFLWPVRGRVLGVYGSGRDGTRNDGINIAAPRGAAVEAADGGVVAYTGNELRGYGNLILVKHTNGWISAYAHCDQILVKRGDKVARGQTIAHVGSTGNVSEPQLHFELRRGNHAVDPREFLAPLPTAGAEKSPPPG